MFRIHFVGSCADVGVVFLRWGVSDDECTLTISISGINDVGINDVVPRIPVGVVSPNDLVVFDTHEQG